MGGMTDLSDSHTISIGVLDNDSLALNAIAVMTSRLSPRFHIIWSTTSPAMALQRCMTHGARPDVLVVDMALGGITGADICARIRRRTPTIGLVCVTSYDLDPYRQDAVEAGAQCLIAKDDIVKELPQANDARKVRQRLARERAEQFIVEHSTLTPPPDEPVVQQIG